MKFKKDDVPVIPSKDIILGSKQAPVKLLLFGDYESNETAHANKVILDLFSDYEDSVSYSFRHFPMTRIHQKAHKAAEAAIGAAQEGKFWEMHSLLFANKLHLGQISLKSYAREAGVLDKKFLDHLINSDWGLFVQDDLREGLDRGVKEIPALFINGERFTKDITNREVRMHIEGILKKSKTKVAAKRA
jgi:protein-disulfide isomerase